MHARWPSCWWWWSSHDDCVYYYCWQKRKSEARSREEDHTIERRACDQAQWERERLAEQLRVKKTQNAVRRWRKEVRVKVSSALFSRGMEGAGGEGGKSLRSRTMGKWIVSATTETRDAELSRPSQAPSRAAAQSPPPPPPPLRKVFVFTQLYTKNTAFVRFAKWMGEAAGVNAFFFFFLCNFMCAFLYRVVVSEWCYAEEGGGVERGVREQKFNF